MHRNRSCDHEFFPGKDPDAGDAYQCDAIAQVIVPRTVDLGDFAVRRALPSARRAWSARSSSSTISGRRNSAPATGLDVRPHPHIGLATVTYLFDGEIMHRDSLGTALAIQPGEVNWMTAGRGIVHSERTAARTARARRADARPADVGRVAGRERGDRCRRLRIIGVSEFPIVKENGKTVRVVVGALYGASSPVRQCMRPYSVTLI